MLVEPDFFQIRSLEGQQHVAFEEFCCQIARRSNDVPDGSEFQRYRGAGGDGGVECVWILPNGQEWGWQAKYISELKKSQLDNSVETALEIHPNLTRYTICLPFDFTGKTSRRGKSETEKYEEYKQQWLAWAESRGMEVEFVRLCKSDLLDELLAFDPHGGRRRFWFDTEHFGEEWFKRHLKETAKAAEPRYTPELRVDVPVAAAFEALGRTPRWMKSMSQLVEEVAEVSERWTKGYTRPGLGSEEIDFPSSAMESARLLDDQLHSIKATLKEVVTRQSGLGLIAELGDVTGNALETASNCLSAAIEDLEAKHGEGMANSVGFRHFMAEYQVSFPARHVDTTRDVIETLEKLRDWVNKPEARLPASPAMLLLGPAGIGKTHAVCDIALDRHERDLRSIALLGEKFSHGTGEPWERIRSLIGLGTDIACDELYGLLDAAGESSGYPLILFIDALNETEPRKFWYDSLSSLVEQISDYDWIKLCVSCRSTYYEDVVAPNVQIPKVEHKGFAGVEFDACFEFFRHYELEPPSMPLMQPEFSNPLFLRLVCESLHGAGVKRLPEGMVGISQVIHYLLKNKNKKIARALDYNPKEELVQEALKCILSEMENKETTWLPWKQGKELVDSIWPSQQRSSSLFDRLLREGLTREDKITTPSGESQDAILISFERLAEYLLAKQYLSKIPKEALRDAFSPGGALDFALSDKRAVQRNRGLLEALAIQIPENYGLELTQLADERVPDSTLAHIVVESLIWRDDESLDWKTGSIVRRALSHQESFDSAMETLLALSTRADNPLNADWFHSLLSSVAMPDRDSFLCPYLHEAYGQQRNLDRLIRWALKANLGEVSSEVAKLWATQLCWFCAAADRRVRDYATKALVRLMEDHPATWPAVIERFSRIDDEYVIERCLAAAYGSLIRADDNDAIRQTALTTYGTFFEEGLLPQNAMVRDYARLILELAAHRNLLPDHITPEQYRPPYESEWPLDWPDRDFVEQYSDSYWELPKLHKSCLHDDFARYTVESALRGYEDINPSQAQRWIFKHILNMGYTTERFAGFDGYMLAEYGPGRSKPAWAERIGKKYQWIALYRLMARVADNCERDTHKWVPSVPELQALGQRKIDPTILIKEDQRSDAVTWWTPVDYDFRSVETLSDDDWLDEKDFPDSAEMLQIKGPADGGDWIVLQAYLHWRSKNEDSDERYPYRMIWMQLRSYLVKRVDRHKCWNWLGDQDFMGRWMPEGLDMHEGFLGEYPWGVPFFHSFERFALDQLYDDRTDSRMPCKMLPTAHSLSSGSEYDAYQEDNIVVMVPAWEFFTHSSLRWNTRGGYLADSGKLCFNYPAASQPGPAALLAEREQLLSFLEEENLVLAWTVLAEKQCIHGFGSSHELGYAKHSRAHMLADGSIRSTSEITDRVKPERA